MTTKTILVIDDSETVRTQVKLLLEDAGYGVLEAEDGVAGVALLRESPSVALALCDVNMPRLNGIEMLEHLRALGIAPLPPVVMLTTEGRPDLVERARKAGARGWIVKPFKDLMLLATVRKVAGAA